MKNDPKPILVFEVPPHNNGGESLIITTKKDDRFLVQEITLQSYGNSASFDLCINVLTPTILREFADALEIAIKENA